MNTQNQTPRKIPENLWQRDEHLRRAAEMMDRMGTPLRAVSFDFFDTLVWRLVDRPSHVFAEVGERLQRKNALRVGLAGSDFEMLRRKAETKAREKQIIHNAAREDIDLKDIYDGLKFVVPDAGAAAQMEHAVECEVCQINPGMADFLHHIRGRGLRAVIISDIYFSAAQLKDILTVNQFDPSIFEFVLTSSEAGVCKSTGNLFRAALEKLNLKAGQMLHIGDNYQADVVGARLAGVVAIHYPQETSETRTILERERILLGAQTPVFSANPLRLMAARYFAEETPEAFFARTGAFIMGPIMSRFASWACQQFLSSGIRKVGAFMREGDLFAKMLQCEADDQGYDLETKPLFVNRKSTALAALGPLHADGVVNWLQYRTTLSIRKIFEDLGFSPQDLERIPFPLDELADTKEKILELAKYIFRPEIAKGIEAKSAEERGKVMDYIRPWIQENNTLGVCDLGYNASAQMQLARIFELESSGTRMVGCYMATHEKAAERVLKGLDVRHFLGAFAKPDVYFRTFIRSPAFLEQSLVAPLGTTLGYERAADGSVAPVTDRMPFSDEMLRCQKAFKEGALLFQLLWQSARAVKPGLLGAQSEFSRRVLADLDAGSKPLLARATAFPLPSEVRHFGSLPLDDYFYADSKKTLCSEKNRALLREQGYGRLLVEADVYWPQATHAQENPRANADFFSYANAILYCNPERDTDGLHPELTVFVRAAKDPAALRQCLERLAEVAMPDFAIELVVAVPKDAKPLSTVVLEFVRQYPRFKGRQVEYKAPLLPYLNQAVDASLAPHILFIEEETRLKRGWDTSLLGALRTSPDMAAVLPEGSKDGALLRCLLLRRQHFVSGLGFQDGLCPEASALNLLLRMRDLGFKTTRCPDVLEESKTVSTSWQMVAQEASYLRKRWPDFENFLLNLPVVKLSAESGSAPVAPVPRAPSAPRVAIVIPTCNKLDLTRRCLQAVFAHTPAPAHEIIMVDNGSTDGTVEFLRDEEQAGRLRAILNSDNAGFAKACNQGASAARGAYVVFLSNDTEVQSNWLGSLFSLAEADAAVAAVGSKLLFPDGTIQHAGIALADCWDHDPLHAFHLFAKEKSDVPLANQRRVYQAVTAACMLVRKAHFDQVSGFDEEFWNGCEDVDLCLRFQQQGWLTIYEPASVVIHHASHSGPEATRRVPQNVERFHKKWLDHASPDVTIDQDGKNRMVPNSVMRLYSPPPGKLVSIVILAHNQLSDSQHCLASIEKHTTLSHELILVDNGSTDGTSQFFRNYAAKHSHVRVIFNRANLGFSAGNNQGLACARGDAILLLNNDTVVTPGWLERMMTHLELYPDCGLVGPVSNSVSGPQLVSTANYSSLNQLPKFATQWCATHAGQSIEAARLVGFCLLFRRSVLEKIGGLDPQFGSGNFEDDDFCIRAVLAGFKLRIALDSFVHHTGGQTFKGAKIDYLASMERNWALFKAKWSMPQDAPLEKGYRLPSCPPNGLALRLALPELKDSHTPSLEGRCWIDKAMPVVVPKKSSRQTAAMALPPCGLIGQLGEARELVRKKQWSAAWTAALSAVSARPFHPEAYLLLAEIALAAGDADSARLCAQAARDMAPDWAPPKQFLKCHLRGHVRPAWLKLLPPLTDPHATASRVSICLIAKNEERFLAQCLRSVRELATQIVVVDTGSTDRTIEIAKEFGAEVYSFAWCDEFSAARNAALEHATGDWVLIIDADEELAPRQLETAKLHIQAAGVLGYRLPIINQGHEDGGCSYVPRLFRNAPGLFFIGRIHEQAFSSIQVRCKQWGLKHQLGEAVLLHHGYTDEVMASRSKIERNLRLLERAIEELPGEPNLIMSLGLELVRSGKLEAGLERYWEAFRLMSALPAAEVTPELKETLLTQLATHLMAAKRFSEIVQLWQTPFAKTDGMTASQHFCLGVALMELKQPAEAAEQMRQCAAKRNQPVLSPINPEIRKAGPHHCLAMCLIALNDADGAKRAFDDALAVEPSSGPMRFDLARFHAAQGRMGQALEIVRQLAAENPADSRVWELGGQIVLSRPEHLAFAREWTADAVKHFPDDQILLLQRAEALLLNHEVAQALPLWRRGQASGSLRPRAALVICELLTGDRQHHFTAAEEPAISQEVVKWYRQCIRMGAHALINQLHERMESIRLTLPTFVKVLEAAHRQARQVAA